MSESDILETAGRLAEQAWRDQEEVERQTSATLRQLLQSPEARRIAIEWLERKRREQQ